MDIIKHRLEHKRLHEQLDFLIADFIIHNRNKSLNKTSIMKLMQWSYSQTLEPDE